MRRWCTLLLLGLCVWATSASAERAVRFDFGAGSSSLGTLDDYDLAQPRPLTGLAALSIAGAGGLRTTAEAQFLRFSAHTGYRAIPEVTRVGVDPTGVATFMLGMEWQPPLQSAWSPFLHASMGAARISAGDEHWTDMNLGPFDELGATRTLPAWSAGLGVRGRVLGIGPGLFADARYTWTDQNNLQRLKLTQVFAGVTF